MFLHDDHDDDNDDDYDEQSVTLVNTGKWEALDDEQ